eukprot:2416383-Lingulodinium_polyedra.AAC.1
MHALQLQHLYFGLMDVKAVRMLVCGCSATAQGVAPERETSPTKHCGQLGQPCPHLGIADGAKARVEVPAPTLQEPRGETHDG